MEFESEYPKHRSKMMKALEKRKEGRKRRRKKATSPKIGIAVKRSSPAVQKEEKGPLLDQRWGRKWRSCK